MKVKVTRKFNDRHTNVLHRRGDVLEISQERYEEIMRVGAFVMQIAQDDDKTLSDVDASNESQGDDMPAEAGADAPTDGLDAMSMRELREYADKAYKLTFKVGMKKSEIIEVIRRREKNGA